MRSPDGSLVSDYEYEIPDELIARYPAPRRDGSRLFVLPRTGSAPSRHLGFADIVELFHPGDILVVNESKVLPARLVGHKPTGARAEVFLMHPAPDSDDPLVWEALVRPGGKLKPGHEVIIGEDLSVEILGGAPGGGRTVRLVTDLTVDEALDRHGHMPLPPYMGREDEPLDRERYQTVYARTAGSVAAPTAGLHFTPELLDSLTERGVMRAEVILHVGIGTFRPVETNDPAEHEMHHERYAVTSEAASIVNDAKRAGGRVWAVGTTAVRTLEAAVNEAGEVVAGSGTTNLFLRPPAGPRVVDGLLTNFHLPRSTLLMLVSAFAGYDRTMSAYHEAIAEGYRFYSYGDAMALLP